MACRSRRIGSDGGKAPLAYRPLSTLALSPKSPYVLSWDVGWGDVVLGN